MESVEDAAEGCSTNKGDENGYGTDNSDKSGYISESFIAEDVPTVAEDVKDVPAVTQDAPACAPKVTTVDGSSAPEPGDWKTHAGWKRTSPRRGSPMCLARGAPPWLRPFFENL